MILHILRKDTRRLWLPVVLTWALLAALARADRWRSDWVPGSLEAWLNLLLPLAWACLVAMVVDQEPLAGDRQFWITRPYRRAKLLAAKALFVVLFIHLPVFFVDAYILAARGFQPLAYIPQLLWKQAILAGALTLPALALASLVRSFTQFMLAVFGVCAAIALLAGGFPSPPLPWQNVEEVRHGLIVVVLASAGATVAYLQFTQRRAVLSRILGVAAALVAGAISAYLSAPSAYAVRLSLIHI